MSGSVLTFNAGSSSIKFAIYQGETLEVLLGGKIDAIGEGANLRVFGERVGDFGAASPPANGDHGMVAEWLLDAIRAMADLPIAGAGHRVVHGGSRFDRPVVIDDEVVEALDRLTPLAREHQPNSLAAIRTVAKCWPRLPQVACFDTSFHRTQPRLAELFAIPRSFADEGLLRYGFHGLSYDYIASVLPRIAGAIPGGGPLVVFHSWVAAYLDEEQQRTLAREVQALGETRPVHHLYCESPFETPGLPTPPSPVPREGPDLATVLVHIGPGGAPVRLADTHPHGYWIRWWPATRPVPRARRAGPAPAPPPR